MNAGPAEAYLYLAVFTFFTLGCIRLTTTKRDPVTPDLLLCVLLSLFWPLVWLITAVVAYDMDTGEGE